MPGDLKVHVIEGRDDPNEGVIGVLRDMLARAESGELQSVAVAAVSRRGFCCTQYDAGDRSLELLGALTVCRRRVENLYADAEGF